MKQGGGLTGDQGRLAARGCTDWGYKAPCAQLDQDLLDPDPKDKADPKLGTRKVTVSSTQRHGMKVLRVPCNHDNIYTGYYTEGDGVPPSRVKATAISSTSILSSISCLAWSICWGEPRMTNSL